MARTPAKAGTPAKARTSRAPRRYWLMKSEPDVFSIDDLAAAPDGTTLWDGIRNYQARNTLRDDVQKGDLVLYYHSRATPPHVAGVAKVVRGGYPDPTQFDPQAKYHDPGASPDAPRWYCVDIRFERKLARPVSLPELKAEPALAEMVVTQKGSRLSVQPVTEAEYKAVLAMSRRRAPQ